MTHSFEFLSDGNANATKIVVLAHGAGAPMDSPFMNTISDGLVEHGCRVVRFEFPYMAERHKTGKKRPPNSMNILVQTWKDVIGELGTRKLIIGGKSMGGRIASMVADEMGVLGLVCLGYPFHPTGKPDQLRIEHLKEIQTPTLVVQGERDAFGNRDEVRNYPLSKSIEIQWLVDGDHSFKPRKSAGIDLQQNMDAGLEAMVQFVNRQFS